MTELLKKIKEALLSVFPVAAIVCLLNLTPLVHFSSLEIGVFLISAVFLILGIGLFSMGADMAMTPMGEHMGAGLTKSKKILLLVSVCFLMGLLSKVNDTLGTSRIFLTSKSISKGRTYPSRPSTIPISFMESNGVHKTGLPLHRPSISE